MNLLRRHWRVALGFAAGALAGLGARALGLHAGAATLVGYDVGALAFLAPTGIILLGDGEEEARRRAGQDDENVEIIMGLVLGAVLAGFGAAVVALREGDPGAGKGRSAWLVGLAVGTLIVSWLVVQSLFALHYAHRYFGDPDEDGKTDQGVKFEGEPPRTYRDFVYMAVCMGATCQVSDFALTTARFRNLVTVHALVAFLFNTLVLALGVSIAGGLLGQ